MAKSKRVVQSTNSTLRGYEKRLAQLLIREQTPRVIKEIKNFIKKLKHKKKK